MNAQVQVALLDAAADEVKIVSAWAIAALSIQGVTFGSLATSKALVALALAELVYLGNWAASFRQSGNPTPPPPTARPQRDESAFNPEAIAAGIARRVVAFLAPVQPLPPAPPPAPSP